MFAALGYEVVVLVVAQPANEARRCALEYEVLGVVAHTVTR